MVTYTNPIIPGFYPDPSVCRVGDDYYLVTSSFEYFPGVPLFHSNNLVEWEQIGYVLTRKSQLDHSNTKGSWGIWAPTICYHDGKFYVTTTNYGGGGNFIVHTNDIRGEWSDPIWIDQGGIDPEIFFDEDGSVYYATTYDMPGNQAIGQCQINIETGEKLQDTRIIWFGSGGKYPEGPHMFRKDGWYYLMIAEGGTEYGHMETIGRGKSPWGPFESCPRNPILTHRDTMLDQYQALGHADLIEDQHGKWWMVFHGIRLSQPMFHHIGRETMLAPVIWSEDGWPLVNEGNRILPEMTVEVLPAELSDEYVNATDKPNHAEKDFSTLDWSFVKNPAYDNYKVSEDGKTLWLRGTDVKLRDLESPTYYCRRQRQFNVEISVDIECKRLEESGCVGLSVYQANEYHYDLAIVKRNDKRIVVLRKQIGDMITESDLVEVSRNQAIKLCIESDKLEYRFYTEDAQNEKKLVGTARTQFISSEAIPMCFTGCSIGIFAEGDSECFAEIEKWKYRR